MDYLHSYRYLFYFVLLSTFCHAQNKNQSDVDFLIKQISAIQMSGKTDQVLEASQQLLRQSSNSKNEKGLSYANYYLAQYYYDHAKFKQSIDHAKKAQKYPEYLKKDKTHSAKISSLLGGNYLLLELYSLSFENYDKALQILESKSHKTTTDSLAQSAVYSHLSYIYENVNKPDSMYYFLQKENAILKTIDLQDAYVQKGCSCLGFGNYHLNQAKIDSAQHYYNRSLEHFKNKEHPCKIEALIGLGKLHASQKNYDAAQKFYDMALESFDQHHFPDILSELYKKIAELKIAQGIAADAKYYSDLYLKTNKELDDRMKKERDFVLHEVMK